MTDQGAIQPLRLLAMDSDDLEIMSAALQDAVTKIGDISWESAAGRLTIAFNRLTWETAEKPKARVRAAIQLGCVLRVRSRNLRPAAPDAVLQLLAVTFEPGEAPGGRVTFAFADGGDLGRPSRVARARRERHGRDGDRAGADDDAAAGVECVDAALADVSEPWASARKPEHDGADFDGT